MPSVDELQAQGLDLADKIGGWAQSPTFYAQIGAIIIAVLAAHFAARGIAKNVSVFRDEPSDGPLLTMRKGLFAIRDLLFALLTIFFLAVAIEVASAIVGTAWLVRIAQGAGVIFLLYTAITRFVTHPLVRPLCLWVAIPVATLQVFGWFDETAGFLDGFSLEVGNIRLSIYFIIKSIVAGAILFWLGRISNSAGKTAIRSQESIDLPTRELFAKLFEIALFVLIFILLLQILGLDLTALTVFGGALGVGLGFGLQQIASNFISGIIILLERSIKVGDYIELEDGKAGILKALNMRSSALETFDGKEIMVPNEKFITSQFTNWTHADTRQRYEVEFSVAYDTDLHKIPPIIEAAVSKHPKVLQEPETPDCELRGFGDSGVEFGVEFWVDGLDDGANKFSSDVLFLVWDALTDNEVEIPFPQREVRLKDDAPKLKVRRKSPEG